MTRTITLGMFIDAIERDGLPKTTGCLFREKKGGRALYIEELRNFQTYKIGAACAVGQACINLGITEPKTSYMSNVDANISEAINYIIDMNDGTKNSLKMIALRARNRFAAHLDTVIDSAHYKEYDYTPHLDADVYKPKGLDARTS